MRWFSYCHLLSPDQISPFICSCYSWWCDWLPVCDLPHSPIGVPHEEEGWGQLWSGRAQTPKYSLSESPNQGVLCLNERLHSTLTSIWHMTNISSVIKNKSWNYKRLRRFLLGTYLITKVQYFCFIKPIRYYVFIMDHDLFLMWFLKIVGEINVI